MLVLLLAVLGACRQPAANNKVATYIGNPQHGLSRQETVGDKRVVCQLLPGEAGNGVYQFRVFIQQKAGEPATDSAMYFLNYRSAELFRLVSDRDTLLPSLCERMANGRCDAHEFTLLFESGKNMLGKGKNLQLLFLNNALTAKDLVFNYQSNDITKAIKKLYGYDQN